jgi:hypothetical protein
MTVADEVLRFAESTESERLSCMKRIARARRDHRDVDHRLD